MKSLLLAVALTATLATANTIYPPSWWRAITQTLPGSTNKRREIIERDLEARNGGDYYYACSAYNLASKYYGYPLSGYSWGGAQIGQNPGTSPFGYYLFNDNGYNTNSAYNCCTIAFSNPNATMFAYFSNYQSPGLDDNGNPTPPQNCRVVSSNNNPIPRGEVLIMGASYNSSAPKGTNYGTYVGNGPLGPGVTYAYDFPSGQRCSSSGSGVALQGNYGYALATGCVSGDGNTNAGSGAGK